MTTTDDIRWLEYYVIPKHWNVHLIDRKTPKNQLDVKRKTKLISKLKSFPFIFFKDF